MFDLNGKVVGIVCGAIPPGEEEAGFGEGVGPEDRVVVWFGNLAHYWGIYTFGHDVHTIYEFLKKTLGEALVSEIFQSET